MSVKDVKEVARIDLQKLWSADGQEGNAAKKVKSAAAKGRDDPLPASFALLQEFYEEMEAAISLLRIRHQVCSFSAICKAVESSTQRRFLHSHIAQMKHIFPEALQVEEYVGWNPETQCTRKDMRIALLPFSRCDGGDCAGGKQNEMVVRRQEFRRRLVELAKTHSKDGDIPQAIIPDHHLAMARPTSASAGDGEAPKPNHPELTEDLPAHPDDDHDPPLALPMAFHVSQLKKFPRLQRTQLPPPPPPPPATSHLPPIFRPHFSVPSRRRSEAPLPLENQQQQQGRIVAHASSSQSPPSSLPPLVRNPVDSPHTLLSSPSFKPHFSLKPCHVPASSSKPPSILSTPQKSPSQSDSSASDPGKETSSSVFLASPPTRNSMLRSSKCQTPVQTPCSILSNPFFSPPHSSYSSPANTPLPTPSASSPVLADTSSKSVPDAPVKNQAVIKSLRFGSPMKRCKHDSRLSESPPKTTPSNTLTGPSPSHTKSLNFNSPTSTLPGLSSLSPLATPTNATSFVTPKKVVKNVSRVLPFDSPTRLQRSDESPQGEANPKAKEPHTPKRSRLPFEPLVPERVEEATSAGSRHNECMETRKEWNADVDGRTVSERCNERSDSVDLSLLEGRETLSASDKEIIKFLPKELVDSVLARERKSLQDSSDGLERVRRRQQLIAGLPTLFNMLRLIFQSCNRTVLTSKDLTQMVLSSHCDITDRGEIKEQLQLLVDLAPEWMSANPSSTGELLYRINRSADMRAVYRSLTHAK